MLELLKTLRTGDHIRVNGQDAMYFDHAIEYGWWLRVWLDEQAYVFVLPNPPEGKRGKLTFDGYESEILTSIELVAKPVLERKGYQVRGDWFYIWYTGERPFTRIFWSMIGPFDDGTYTVRQMDPWNVLRWQCKPAYLAKKYGWTNGVKRINGVLFDRDKAIEFFIPPFLPACLQLPPSQLRLL